MNNNTITRLAIACALLWAQSATANPTSREDGLTLGEDQIQNLRLYELAALYTPLPDDQVNKLLEKAETAARKPVALRSDFSLDQNEQANTVTGNARFGWQAPQDAVALYLEGTYRAQLHGAGWQTAIAPSLALNLRPAANWRLSLRLREKAEHNPDAFESQPLQSTLAFTF